MKVLKNIGLLVALIFTLPALAVTEKQQASVKSALKVNDWDTALDLSEDLVDDFPQSSLAHYLLASAIRVKMQEVSQFRAMFSLGDYKKALIKAIELDPKNIDARTEEIGFYLFAPGIAGGDKEYAAKRIVELKKVDTFSALQMEVQLAAVEKDSEQQIQLLEEILELKPHFSQALMQLAGIKVQQEQYSEADQLFLRVDGDKDAAWPLAAQYQRAKWRILAKQEPELAIELLQSYQEQLPNLETEVSLPSEAAALWRQALAHEINGDNKNAIVLLKRSLAVDDDFEPAEEDLERLSD